MWRRPGQRLQKPKIAAAAAISAAAIAMVAATTSRLFYFGRYGDLCPLRFLYPPPVLCALDPVARAILGPTQLLVCEYAPRDSFANGRLPQGGKNVLLLMLVESHALLPHEIGRSECRTQRALA
jgi:hypothetical protein